MTTPIKFTIQITGTVLDEDSFHAALEAVRADRDALAYKLEENSVTEIKCSSGKYSKDDSHSILFMGICMGVMFTLMFVGVILTIASIISGIRS